jgi:hypothetical protein
MSRAAALERLDPRHVWLLAVCFVVTLAQEPLYTENQNTKFLQGAAAARHGFLDEDWLGGTIDPLPVFSQLVEWLFRIDLPQLSHLMFAALAGLYAWTLVRIAGTAGLADLNRVSTAAWFGAGFLIVHGLGKNWPHGLADQYLLGTYFQPCVFGVALLYAILLYLEGKSYRAMTALALTAAFHPDYLPSTTVCALVFAFAAPAGQRPEARAVASRLALYVVWVVPVLLTLLPLASRTSDVAWAQSMEILTRVRIPQHASVRSWIDAGAVVQLAVMAAGTLWARGPLRIVMSALLALIGVPMVVLAILDVPLLEAITPWRASVFVMPLALTVLLARGAEMLGTRRERWGYPVWTFVALVAVIIGVNRQFSRVDSYASAESMPVIDYAREHAQSKQTYVVPPRARAFYRFRLETGVPIVINWKSHPYRDVDLIEWYERFKAVEDFYLSAEARSACSALHILAQRFSATHVVVPRTHALAGSSCVATQRVWANANYEVWRLGAA